ncbi:MAG: hypothetical protein NVS3B7_10110 [Candidatus Elarobacter sp.]
MSELLARRTAEAVAYAPAQGLTDTRRELVQAGTATLVAGTVTVSGATSLAAGSLVLLSVRTVGGTVGFLSAPSASFVAGTSFVINSSSATDTSVVSWMIVNPRVHAAVTAASVSADFRKPVATAATLVSATAVDLPTCLTLAGEATIKYAAHIADVVGHKVADVTNTLANAAPVDLPSLITWVNDWKAKQNAHVVSTTYHYNADSANVVATANATILSDSITLINAMATAYNAHIASAPAGASVKLIGP